MPQLGQNFEAAGTAVWHLGQGRLEALAGAPQLGQNLAPDGIGVLHLGHGVDGPAPAGWGA